METCEVLLRAGISKDARTKVDRTPLHFAVFEGHEKIVELLLLNKCEIDPKDMVSFFSMSIKLYNNLNLFTVKNDTTSLGC